MVVKAFVWVDVVTLLFFITLYETETSVLLMSEQGSYGVSE